MEDARYFDVVLVNDHLEDTLDKATEIVAAFLN
jgi:guanylate kinase